MEIGRYSWVRRLAMPAETTAFTRKEQHHDAWFIRNARVASVRSALADSDG